jgi:hypothetical protein
VSSRWPCVATRACAPDPVSDLWPPSPPQGSGVPLGPPGEGPARVRGRARWRRSRPAWSRRTASCGLLGCGVPMAGWWSPCRTLLTLATDELRTVRRHGRWSRPCAGQRGGLLRSACARAGEVRRCEDAWATATAQPGVPCTNMTPPVDVGGMVCVRDLGIDSPPRHIPEPARPRGHRHRESGRCSR